MKAPEAESVPRLDVAMEELESLLEQARQEPLREEGYQKLRAAIRTLQYVTELLEKKETTLAALRQLLCPASTEKTEKVLEQGRHRHRRPETIQFLGAAAESGARARAQRRGGLPRGEKNPGAACVLKARRCVSGRMWRQSVPAAPTRRVGANQGAATFGGDAVRIGKAAL